MSENKRKKQIAAIKGTADILPSEVRMWQRVEETAKSIFELYGYREMRTPVFEATELFKKGTGATSDIVIKEMYTFKDKGGRSLTLRPEYTPSVVRAIIENRLNLLPQSMRFYYIGPMFRYDKPQKGRFRQFHQADVEVFGEKDPAVDAEIVQMAVYLLEKLQVTEVGILVNSVGCRECRPSYSQDLRAHAERLRDSFCSDCQRKVKTNPLRIFDCKVETCQELAKDLPVVTDYLCQECEQHFREFCAYLDLYGLGYTREPRLVRGLDYYTKTTFEIVSSRLGAQDAILGGGRYDDMMMDFGGEDICGIGFAMGMERLLSLLPDEKRPEKFVYFAWMGAEAKRQCMQLAKDLRGEGLECLLEFNQRSLKNQMSRANKLGARWVLIVGEEEIRSQQYQLKIMETGKQQAVVREDILSRLLETSRD
jgi:histidyl-tRNA synthetase